MPAATGDPAPRRRAGLVLCGGRSRRMGRDKADLPFGDGSLLERVVGAVATAVDGVWLVAREGQPLPESAARVTVEGVARDPAQGLGPLAGIVAGLRAAGAERAFVASCDAPLLAPAVVELLFTLAEGHAAVIPEVGGHLTPTTAVYGRALLPAAERLLAAGELRPRRLVAEPGVRVVGEDELREVDPELLSFRDCDTPEDYAALLARAGLDATMLPSR